jgi:hypothetical protein
VFFEFSAEGAPPVGAAFFDFIATFYASLLALLLLTPHQYLLDTVTGQSIHGGA